jgi:hypothetical protein
MILTVILEGISKIASVLSVLMNVFTFLCHDRGYCNVVLVLQSCSDSLHILPGSSSDRNATSDCAYHVGNMKDEGELDMKVEVEEKVKMKTEKGLGSKEEECIDIKEAQSIYSEEEVKEEDINIKDEEDVGMEKGVSIDGRV